MEYTTLGPTGVEVSRLCLGTSRLGVEDGDVDGLDGRLAETSREQVHAVLDAAADCGVNFLDTANVYGEPSGRSEALLGEWLADRDREEFVVASKVRHPVGDGPNRSGLSRKHVRAQVEASLDRLGTDYLDLYYLHRPDPETPLRRTLATLDDLVQDGLVHAVGLSNYPAWEVVKACWRCDRRGREPPAVVQLPFNAVERPDDHLDACADLGLGVCGYRALCAGFLTGKYDRDGAAPGGSRGDCNERLLERVGDPEWAVLDAVRAVAGEVGATPARVALRWLMDHDRLSVVPVVGARTPAQVRENAGAVAVSLSAAQHDRITDALADSETAD